MSIYKYMIRRHFELNNIYENNKKILKEKYIEIYKDLLKWEKKNCEDVIIEVGEQVLVSKKKDARTYSFNSRYNNDEFVEKWLSKNDIVKDHQVYILFGTSNYNCVRKLMEKINRNNIMLIYEPDKDIFFEVIKFVDISDVLKKDNILLVVDGVNKSLFIEFMECVIVYATVKLLKILCMPNYDILYKEIYNNIIEAAKNRIKKVMMDRNTVLISRKGLIENTLYGISDMKNEYSVNQLVDICKEKCNYKDVPAIIVSAGPSLNKNIDILKKAEKRSVIITVDTAVKTVLSHGITPDLIVSIDWEKPPVLFMNSKFFNIPMVVFDCSNKKISEIHKGKRFYFSYDGSCLYDMFKKVKDASMIGLATGGSVANNAFSLAVELGFENIILIGQDLAYTNNEMHSKEAYGGIDADKADDVSELTEVEDVFGGKVYAPYDMEQYRVWFENQIAIFEELNVIDATEGGAKIHGSKIMTLSDAIDEYCRDEFDISSEIEKIYPAFNEEEKVCYEKKENGIEEELDRWKKDLKELLLKYDKVLELGRKSKLSSNEYIKLVKEIGEWTEKIESNSILGLASKYDKIVEYEILGKVYDIKDNEKDEIKEIITNGKRMIEAYLKGIDELKKDIIFYTTFNEEQFTTDMGMLMEEIQKLKECMSEVDVNQVMKELYTTIVDLINMAGKLKVENVNVVKKYLNEVLYEIVGLHEKNDNIGMVECLESKFVKACENVRDLWRDKV